MFVGGLLLLLVTLAWGIPQLIGSEYGTKATAKIVGLGLGIGIVLIAAGVRDLRLYRLKKT